MIDPEGRTILAAQEYDCATPSADRWLWQVGNRWIAAVEAHEASTWWDGTSADEREAVGVPARWNVALWQMGDPGFKDDSIVVYRVAGDGDATVEIERTVADFREAEKRALRALDTGEHPVVWREERDGLVAKIVADDEGMGAADPRDCDNLGRMVCWHPDYYLGDEQIQNDGRGAVRNAHEYSGRFSSIGALARYCRTALGAVVVLPLYLLDHSGISMSAGDNYVGRGDTASGGRDEFGNARGWDTTLVGVIYATRERVAELCGSADYKPDDYDGTPEQWLAKQLHNEVALYDRYLRGEAYGYVVKDEAADEVLDSCWGYLPDVSERHDAELDYLRSEAHTALEIELASRREAAEHERVEAARWANQDVHTVDA